MITKKQAICGLAGIILSLGSALAGKVYFEHKTETAQKMKEQQEITRKYELLADEDHLRRCMPNYSYCAEAEWLGGNAEPSNWLNSHPRAYCPNCQNFGY